MSVDQDRVEALLPSAKRTQTGWRAPCPFCEDEGHRDRKTSLVIQASGYFFCFRCAIKGRLREAPDPAYAAHRTIELLKGGATIKEFEPPPYFVELGVEPGLTALAFEEARAYLQKRGVPPSVQHRAGIGACYDGRWAGRVLVPITSPKGDQSVWFGWSGRLWCNPRKDVQGIAGLKYLYPPEMSRGEFFYNQRALDIETDVPLLVVEGVFDVLPFFDDAVATLGKMSARQTMLLREAKRPVCFAPDGDAWREGHADALKLQFDGRRAGCLRLPPRKDPDEFSVCVVMDAAIRSIGHSNPVHLE